MTSDLYRANRNYKNFIDIDLNFEPNALTGDLLVLKNEDSINNSIQNLVLTILGEVPFQYDIGSTVYNYLFENPDLGTSALIQEEVRRTIKYNEPRVEVEDVIVEIEPDIGQIEMTVKYKIIGYDEIVTFTQLLVPARQ